MENDSQKTTGTSRRNFTKSALTLAVAAPFVSSILGCRKVPDETAPIRTECCPGSGGGTSEHIPPMGLDGGGSLIIDTRNRLGTNDMAPPFRYVEHPDIGDPRDQLGNLVGLRVITELIDDPFIQDVSYSGVFPDDCQLLLWYERVAPTPTPTPPPSPLPTPLRTGPVDCVYGPDDFNREPDVRIVGGRQAAANRRFVMTLNSARQMTEHMSHKCARSYRYRDADDGTARGHFRVGRWRVVRSDGTTPLRDSNNNPIENTVASAATTTRPRPEHFRLYVTFDHLQPHS